MSNHKLTRFQMIEMPVPATGLGIGQRLYVPDQPQLRTQTNQIIAIQRLSVYDAISNPNTPTGAATASVANLGVSYLVLNVFGTETMQFIPLTELNNQNSSATAVQRVWATEPRLLNDITKVDWTKSYIQVGAAVAAGVSYLIGVDYLCLPDDFNSILNAQEMPIVS